MKSLKSNRVGAWALGASVVIVLSACAPMKSASTPAAAPATPPKDGELAVPAGYKTWPKFLSAVQRPDAKQVREIYMNAPATKGTQAAGFPNGSIFVMENYAARANADGTLMTGPDGKLVKGELLRVFVMGKGEGWGASAPETLKNGDWVYAAYMAGGDKAPDPTSGCRACHLPLVTKDYVHRYDEYFQSRPVSALPAALPAAVVAAR